MQRSNIRLVERRGEHAPVRKPADQIQTCGARLIDDRSELKPAHPLIVEARPNLDLVVATHAGLPYLRAAVIPGLVRRAGIAEDGGSHRAGGARRNEIYSLPRLVGYTLWSGLNGITDRCGSR